MYVCHSFIYELSPTPSVVLCLWLLVRAVEGVGAAAFLTASLATVINMGPANTAGIIVSGSSCSSSSSSSSSSNGDGGGGGDDENDDIDSTKKRVNDDDNNDDDDDNNNNCDCNNNTSSLYMTLHSPTSSGHCAENNPSHPPQKYN